MPDRIRDVLHAAIDRGDFPSAAYLVAEKGEIRASGAIGRAVVHPVEIAAADTTIYDLASLTKVLATTLLTAIFIQQGRIHLETNVTDVIPELKRAVNLKEIATHVSGFPAWRPLYLLAGTRAAVLETIGQIPYDPKQGVVYSDLNFIVLGCLLERLAGDTLVELFDKEIGAKLGLRSTCFNPPTNLKDLIAASENGNGHECSTCVEMGFLGAEDCGSVLRQYPIWGEVHDGNAWFMGGVAGHAGLFSTIHEVRRLAEQFLPASSSLLDPAVCQLFRTNLTPNGNEDRSFGFQLASTKDSTAGPTLAPDSFGHLGFTGTSLWVEPERERIFVLLTNRTHDHSLPLTNINSVRRTFHEAATDTLEKSLATIECCGQS